MATHACPVCGCGELRCDEVYEPERTLLIECPRCELRQMERLVPVLRAPLRAILEAAEVAAA
jgi:hypothetical protein